MDILSKSECTYGECMWYPTLNKRHTVFFGDLKSGNEVEFEIDNDKRERNKEEVQGVIVCKIEITKVPENIHRDFPNIVCLHISSCMELREICREDLKGLEKLREIAITGTLIEEIPGDLFEDLVNLEVIELLMNQIKFIGRDVFKPLKRIAYIDLGLNAKINAIFVGDPYEFPDGINNSTKCETLEILNKLIAKMKPIKRRKSMFSEKIIKNEIKPKNPKIRTRSKTIATEQNFDQIEDNSRILPDIKITNDKIIRYDAVEETNNSQMVAPITIIKQSVVKIKSNEFTPLSPREEFEPLQKKVKLSSLDEGEERLKNSDVEVTQNQSEFTEKCQDDTNNPQFDDDIEEITEEMPNFEIQEEIKSTEEFKPQETVTNSNIQEVNLSSNSPILINDNSSTDLIIKVNQTDFHVNKEILAKQSQVFADKFHNKPKLKKIELKFVSVEVFKIIRDFMYGENSLPLDFKLIEEVFKQATFLKIDQLRQLTSKLLIESLDFDNAMTVFQIGTDYGDEEMKMQAFEMVKKILPGQIEKEEQMSDLLILKELVRAKYLRKRKSIENGGN